MFIHLKNDVFSNFVLGTNQVSCKYVAKFGALFIIEIWCSKLMLAKNTFKKLKKSSSTAHWVWMRLYNRACINPPLWGGFSFCNIAERLARIVSSVHDCWQQWSRENTASRRLGSGQPHGINERKCLMYGCGASYCICSKILCCSWYCNDTMNCFKLVTWRTDLSQTPCSMHSTDSRLLSFAMLC